jgi:RecG-like helicase
LSQTDTTDPNSDERIRKIYVKDLKQGEAIHTVFRASHKEKHVTRGGKNYLALTFVDRTGQVDGRVFDNVDAADQAFSADDYLLVKGKIGQFHGKTQVVVDRLERLDPGPIDANEFAYTAPVTAAVKEKEQPKDKERSEDHHAKLRLSKRLERLLESPQLAQALDNFVAHLEKVLDAQRGTLPPRPERKARGPRVERKPERAEHEPVVPTPREHKHEPKRDPSLPEGLAFKPFNALIAEGDPKAETPTT